jgi:hypothetical protein
MQQQKRTKNPLFRFCYLRLELLIRIKVVFLDLVELIIYQSHDTFAILKSNDETSRIRI